MVVSKGENVEYYVVFIRSNILEGMFTKCYVHQVLLLHTMNCDERPWNTFVGRASFSFGSTFWRECSPIVEYC